MSIFTLSHRKRAETDSRKSSIPNSKEIPSHHPTDPVELRRLNFQTPGRMQNTLILSSVNCAVYVLNLNFLALIEMKCRMLTELIQFTFQWVPHFYCLTDMLVGGGGLWLFLVVPFTFVFLWKQLLKQSLQIVHHSSWVQIGELHQVNYGRHSKHDCSRRQPMQTC